MTEYLKGINTDGIISDENVNRAHLLLEFFNKTKLIFSGYESEVWGSKVTEILAIIIKNINENDSNVRTIEQIIANKIFSKAELCVELKEINQSLGKKSNAKLVMKVANTLVEQNLGRIKLKTNTQGPVTKHFEKNIINVFTHDIISALELNDINLIQFKSMNAELECKKYLIVKKKL